MKKRIPLVAILLGWASVAWGAGAPVTLTTLRAVHNLTNAEASLHLPAAFEATVTYYHKDSHVLFVQDGSAGIFVSPNTDDALVPGDRVLVRGKTEGSYHPIVISESVVLLHHDVLPMPVPAVFDQLIRGQRDCMLVTVRGVVRAADKTLSSDQNFGVNLQLLTEGGYIQVSVYHLTGGELEELLDSEVEVTGIAGGLFDGKMQAHGVVISVSSPAGVRILKRAETSPWSLPLTPMGQVITNYHVTDHTQRVRVHGTITYYQPGSAVVLQDGASSIWISTWTELPMQVGDVVDATGFPEAHNGFLALARGEVRDSYLRAPIAPLQTTRKDLTSSYHIIDLVSVEAQVVTEARGGTQDEYLLTADGQLFTAIYRHPGGGLALPPMRQIPIGSKVRITGICITEDSNPFDSEVGFDILMRSFDDITVVAQPSLINTRNLIIAVSLLLLVIIAVSARGWGLERKMRRQTAAMSARTEAEADLERRRSRILEDINGSKPLAEIIEEIAEMVSFILKGAPSWCEIADGARLGNPPPEANRLRVLREEIPARSGLALGTIFAAFDPAIPPAANERDALSAGTRLATLAIETRRLYSDLLHRSEFDLLTDIHNRFSLEAHLDANIDEARANAGIFGLIYVDLDDFKQVNDLYGHHIGDLYLQEVAGRMKQQLRSHDLLARLGGDEFAVLLPKVRNRAGVEEIAQRLERCFDAPLILEGHSLQGSASFGIALYPESGATKDSLLSAADTAMYAIKNGKRKAEMDSAESDISSEGCA
jgi:diguanylate cyclase (GGDEF)-like protein